jgi:DNA modification methylase
MLMEAKILVGDVRTRMSEIPDGSVQCVVTSPPYWGLRDYGQDGQIGLEQTPQEYVAEMVAVFREVWRVLADDGVLWLNLGDSYKPAGNGSTKKA